MEAMTMKQFVEKGIQGNKLIIDLRSPRAFALRHIPGAINIPYERLNLERTSFNKSTKLVFYCEHGSKSMAACSRYERYGYMTYDLLGGFEEYKRIIR